MSPGRIVFTNFSLHDIFTQAYRIKDFQVSGPAFLETTRFNIEGKFPAAVDQADRVPEMLQSMLEDRFKLSAHKESKAASAYVLVAAKGGAKLKPSTDDKPTGFRTTSGGARSRLTGKADMATFAELLSNLEDRPVVDMTGISGVYEFDLEWSAENSVNDIPSLPTVLQEKLGLRLESRKTNVDIYVIDHISRVPSEN